MYKDFKRKTIFPDRDAKKFNLFCFPMKDLCKSIAQRIKERKDCTILVTGKTGVGKSTVVGKACFNHFEYIDNVKVPGEKMYTDENFVIDPEILASMMITKKGCVLWADESRPALASRSWQSKINNLIINRKNQNRKNGIVSFIVLPYEKEVDKSFLNHINMWIWVYKRGQAQVFVAGNHKKGGESLSVRKIIDREEKWYRENPNSKFCFPRIHQEYIGNLSFGAFTKAEEKRYNKLVKENSAVGKLSEDEEKIVNGENYKEPEEYIPEVLDEVEKGDIKSKREMWDKLKSLTKFTDTMLVRHINRHLKIRGYKTFNAFVVE